MQCIIEACDRNALHKGLCGMHYKRQWRHSDPTKTLTPGRGFERIICVADDGCNLTSEYSNGLCEKHYQMWRVFGRTKRINNLKGHGSVNAAGYIVHTVDGERKYEHIILAEMALGKPLPKGAVVHHMNEQPWDNFTPFNLVICPSQEYHALLHRRMKELGYANNPNT